MTGRHTHISGRPRDYISRKWFHRARHRPKPWRRSVDVLVEQIGMEPDPRSSGKWPVTKNGKFYIFEGTIEFPRMPQ